MVRPNELPFTEQWDCKAYSVPHNLFTETDFVTRLFVRAGETPSSGASVQVMWRHVAGRERVSAVTCTVNGKFNWNSSGVTWMSPQQANLLINSCADYCNATTILCRWVKLAGSVISVYYNVKYKIPYICHVYFMLKPVIMLQSLLNSLTSIKVETPLLWNSLYIAALCINHSF